MRLFTLGEGDGKVTDRNPSSAGSRVLPGSILPTVADVRVSMTTTTRGLCNARRTMATMKHLCGLTSCVLIIITCVCRRLAAHLRGTRHNVASTRQPRFEISLTPQRCIKKRDRTQQRRIILFPTVLYVVPEYLTPTPPPPLPMPVFSISTTINQCYCFCHHGNWTCCISCKVWRGLSQ